MRTPIALLLVVASGVQGSALAQGDDCSNATLLDRCEGTTPWNNATATTSGFDGGDPLTCMGPANADLSAMGQIHADLFWQWTVPCDGNYRIDTEGSTQVTNTRLSVHLGTGCSAVCVVSDDDSGSAPIASSAVMMNGAVAGDPYLIQFGSWSATSPQGEGVLNIVNWSAPCKCGPQFETGCVASPHYLGGAAMLDLMSFGVTSPTGVRLECTGGPPGEFGFFLVSADHTGSLAIFNGVLCLDSPQGRYNPQIATNQGLPQLDSVGQFDASGVLQNLAGTSSSGSGFDIPLELPFNPVGQQIMPGDFWAFQCWYRDRTGDPPVPGSTANFSNSIKHWF